MNLGSQSENYKCKKKIQAITEIFGKEVSASALKGDLEMSSIQLSHFLKRIDEIKRFKKYNTYRYKVNTEEVPNRIEYGEHWVEIEEKDDKYIIKNSNGEERTVKK